MLKPEGGLSLKTATSAGARCSTTVDDVWTVSSAPFLWPFLTDTCYRGAPTHPAWTVTLKRSRKGEDTFAVGLRVSPGMN